MLKHKKYYLIIVILIGVLCIGTYIFYPRLIIATGFAAKITCSCLYVANRKLDEVTQTNLYHSILPYVKVSHDAQKKTVTASFFGLQKQEAIYKEGVGCVLMAKGRQPSFLYKRFDAAMEADTLMSEFSWIEGSTKNMDKSKLDVAVSSFFDQDGSIPGKRTTAVLVIHHDTLVAEKYASAFDKTTPLAGWSMTKSILNAFVGLMVQNGKLDPSNNRLFREWDQDERSKITLHDLLQMQSGLTWEEDYTKVCDVTKMLYDSPNVTDIPKTAQAEFTPGTQWKYSSGTTNLISGYLRNKFGNDEAYHSYIYRRLAEPLGMESFIMETDVTGNYVGSTYGWATPRDWAKFGRLYLHDGVWQGKRLLPDYWVNYTRTPAEFSKGQYGAHFWLNKEHCLFKDAPEDLYFMDGYQGQFVFIIPSLDLIIVRMGSGDKHFDANAFLKGVIESLEK